MDFDCYQSTEIALLLAQYTAGLEKRSRLADGTWALGTGAFLHFELLECYGGMKKGEIEPLLRCKAIAAVAAEVPRGRMDAGSIQEIRGMLEEARSAALATMRGQEGDMKALYKKAALSIQKDLHRFKTIQA
jgi:hypothetical protein